jgi:N-acetyl-gamma-glutamyl-phosphate reductase
MIRAGILGGTGYVGQELIRLLYNHKDVELTKIMSTSFSEQSFSYVYRNFTGLVEQQCLNVDYSTIADGIDVLFTSLPYGVLMEHLTLEIMSKVKIIDLGVDYRFMNEDDYLKYYGKTHLSMQLADKFAYGLSEWNEHSIRKSNHIANPGCYATAIELALLPLLKEDVIDRSIIADGKCAVSGSGRALTLGTHFAEANESTKAYRITSHPHKQEVVKAIEYFTQEQIDLMFVPHIVPMQRGLLVTCYTTLKQNFSYEAIRQIYDKYYLEKQFIQILGNGIYVETKWVKNSNMCHINFEIDQSNSRLIIIVAIDNLIKGAAGQAVQNMNIMFGLPENTGIDIVPMCI